MVICVAGLPVSPVLWVNGSSGARASSFATRSLSGQPGPSRLEQRIPNLPRLTGSWSEGDRAGLERTSGIRAANATPPVILSADRDEGGGKIPVVRCASFAKSNLPKTCERCYLREIYFLDFPWRRAAPITSNLHGQSDPFSTSNSEKVELSLCLVSRHCSLFTVFVLVLNDVPTDHSLLREFGATRLFPLLLGLKISDAIW